jgi:hypothetical protein
MQFLVNIENKVLSPLIYLENIFWLIKEWCTIGDNRLSDLMQKNYAL